MVTNDKEVDCGADGVAVVQVNEIGRFVRGIAAEEVGTAELTGGEGFRVFT